VSVFCVERVCECVLCVCVFLDSLGL